MTAAKMTMRWVMMTSNKNRENTRKVQPCQYISPATTAETPFRFPIGISRAFPATMALLFVFAVFFGFALRRADCLEFNFPVFKNDNRSLFIMTEGKSDIAYDAIQVTRDARGAPITNLSGRVFYGERLRLRRKGVKAIFNTTFVINVSNQTFPGGEGLAFVLADDTSLPMNSEGEWLGIVNETTNGTVQAKIVAVEFDTRKSFEDDIDDNHVGLNVNGINSIKQVPLSSYGVEISRGNDVRGIVKYDGENISIFVSMADDTGEKTKNPIISTPLNLSDFPDEVYVGFSASTSDHTELNCVKSWQFSSTEFGKNKNLTKWILIGVVIFIAAILLISLAVFFYWRKRYAKPDEGELYVGIEDEIKGSSTAPRKFRLSELIQATENFHKKNKLGTGGFGTVYRGVLTNREVAVKRISKDSRQGKQEFITEITVIGSLHHKNLVKLIGWCYHKRDLLLVYEFMPNGSLDRFIYEEDEAAMGESTLKWEKRFNVICHVAEALDYLHNKCEKIVLHRDIKASNIMLDSYFNAKVGDFGLARMIQEREKAHHSTREIAGTPGYMAPESFLTGRATVETDVYAYGVLLLEVICGRKPGLRFKTDEYNNSIVHWLWGFHNDGRIRDAVDKKIVGEYREEEMEILLILGLACCHPNPQKRPSMTKVLQVLNGEAAPPEVPPERPPFVWPPMPPSFKEDLENSFGGNHRSLFTEPSGR